MSKKIALGCSHTYGIGVERNEAWPSLLGLVNYGVPGCSSDLVARTLPKILEKEQPDTVYILWPDWTRFEYFKDGEWKQSHPTDSNRIEFMESHPEEWLHENFKQQVAKVNEMCKGIKVNAMTLDDLIPFINNADMWPLSKLGHHYAPEWHQWVAEIFEKLNETA
tara:strand:+ start:391 stop:885 length:495 start_codon:yes stop_codon:yes gene_type:complete